MGFIGGGTSNRETSAQVGTSLLDCQPPKVYKSNSLNGRFNILLITCILLQTITPI